MSNHKKVMHTPDGIVETEVSAEELAVLQAQTEADEQARIDADAAKAQKEADKANAKAKLMAGEPLTEAEADTIVL